MKKYNYIILAAMLSAVACNNNKQEEPQGMGQLKVSVEQSGVYATKANDDLASFVIDIVRQADGWTKHYDRFADMPQVLDLGSGDYTITISSPEQKDAAWDQPCYEGSADFSIRVGEITPVSLTAKLSNMKVSFVLSENFQKELSNYSITVTNAASWDAEDAASRTLVWGTSADVAADKPGYFSVAPLRVKVDAYRAIDNSETHSELLISDVAAQDYHIINLDARVTGNVGGVTITIDPSVNEKNSDVDVPGWDEVPVDGGNSGDGGDDENPDEPEIPDTPSTVPTMTWEANPTFAPMPIQDEMDVNILIKAPEGIKDFTIDVTSEALASTVALMGEGESDGTHYTMDLINNDALVSGLGEMGIPTGTALKDQTEVNFSLSALVPLISMYDPAQGSEHIFGLRVVDNAGQTLEQAITFYVE